MKYILSILCVMVLSCDINTFFGETPQRLIDEAVEIFADCNEAMKAGDTDAMAECEKLGSDIEKRWEAVMEDLDYEERAEWEEKASNAILNALDLDY